MPRAGPGRSAAGIALLLAAALAGCAAPAPQVVRYTVSRVPGESVVLGRVLIPGVLSGVAGAVETEAVRVTIQTEDSPVVRPIPLTPAGYLLASLPPGRYRIIGWESRGGRATRFGPLDLPFDLPQADRLYYLGTLFLVPQTPERYRLEVQDHLDEATRYLQSEQPRLAGAYERRLLAIPSR